MQGTIRLSWFLVVCMLALSLLPVMGYIVLSLDCIEKGLVTAMEANLVNIVQDVAVNHTGTDEGLQVCHGACVARRWEDMPADVREHFTTPPESDRLHMISEGGDWLTPPREIVFYMRVSVEGRDFHVCKHTTFEGEPRVGSHFREIAGVVWTVGLALALALTVFVHLLVRRVTTPLSALSRWAAALDAKNLAATPPDFTYPELNTLARRMRNSMLTEREALERERRFLRYSSHELRTPISIVRASVECLDRMLDGPRDAAREKRAVQRLNRASAAMTHLVETLLWLGRKADTPPPATMIDLEQIVRDVIADARQLYTHGDVTSVVETQSCTLPLQVGAVEIVVGNVIRNAFQHTRRGIIHIRQVGASVEVTNYMAQGTSEAHAAGFGVGLELTRRLTARFGWAFTSHAHSGHNTSTLCFTQASDASPAREGPPHPPPGPHHCSGGGLRALRVRV